MKTLLRNIAIAFLMIGLSVGVYIIFQTPKEPAILITLFATSTIFLCIGGIILIISVSIPSSKNY